MIGVWWQDEVGGLIRWIFSLLLSVCTEATQCPFVQVFFRVSVTGQWLSFESEEVYSHLRLYINSLPGIKINAVTFWLGDQPNYITVKWDAPHRHRQHNIGGHSLAIDLHAPDTTWLVALDLHMAHQRAGCAWVCEKPRLAFGGICWGSLAPFGNSSTPHQTMFMLAWQTSVQ